MWGPAPGNRTSEKELNYLQELDSSGEPLEVVMLCPASVNSVFLARARSTLRLPASHVNDFRDTGTSLYDMSISYNFSVKFPLGLQRA